MLNDDLVEAVSEISLIQFEDEGVLGCRKRAEECVKNDRIPGIFMLTTVLTTSIAGIFSLFLTLGLYHPLLPIVAVASVAIFYGTGDVELGDIEKMSCSHEQRELEVKAALHEGLPDELARKLQQSLENLSEDGIEQKDSGRLALSRSCYRDSEILILDKPTTSLDPVAENELYANFIEMMKNRSCILISHRLAVARYVDRILDLQRGKLIEDGDHESLMRKNGIYASMYYYYAQSHWYSQDAV